MKFAVQGRKLHNVKLSSFYTFPLFTRITKLAGVRLSGHVARRRRFKFIIILVWNHKTTWKSQSRIIRQFQNVSERKNLSGYGEKSAGSGQGTDLVKW